MVLLVSHSQEAMPMPMPLAGWHKKQCQCATSFAQQQQLAMPKPKMQRTSLNSIPGSYAIAILHNHNDLLCSSKSDIPQHLWSTRDTMIAVACVQPSILAVAVSQEVITYLLVRHHYNTSTLLLEKQLATRKLHYVVELALDLATPIRRVVNSTMQWSWNQIWPLLEYSPSKRDLERQSFLVSIATKYLASPPLSSTKDTSPCRQQRKLQQYLRK